MAKQCFKEWILNWKTDTYIHMRGGEHRRSQTQDRRQSGDWEPNLVVLDIGILLFLGVCSVEEMK